MARGMEKRLEKMEKALGADRPKTARQLAEDDAWATALYAKVMSEPLPPDDPETWKVKNIEGDPVREHLAEALGVPHWRDGKWFWPFHTDADYQPWAGGVSRAVPQSIPE